MLAPASRRSTQDEVIQAFSEEQAMEEANRCFSCGTCNACDNTRPEGSDRNVVLEPCAGEKFIDRALRILAGRV